MNETFYNSSLDNVSQMSNFTFSNFKSEWVAESVDIFSFSELILSLFLVICICFLTFKIYSEAKKIDNIIGSVSLKAFSKSFYFYLLLNICFLVYTLFIFLNIYFTSDFIIELSFWAFMFLMIGFLLFAWIARSYLLFSVSYKIYEEKLNNSLSSGLFLFFIFFAILFDFILSMIIMILFDYGVIYYNILLIVILLYFLFKKIGLKNVSKHIPYLTIVLLLFLRFTNSFDIFITSDESSIFFDFGIDLLTLFIYIYIFRKLLSWRKKFEK